MSQQVVQAQCPGCKQTLRIPADWIQQTLKCKHCGLVIQARSKAAAPVAVPPAAKAPQLDEMYVAAGSGPIIRSPLEHKSGRLGRLFAITVFVLVAGAAGAFFLRTQLLGLFTGAPPADSAVADKNDATDPAPTDATKPTPKLELPTDQPFPRRALGICVSNYLYANPVGYGAVGQSGQNLHSLMQKLSRVLHIPAEQLVELSDATFQPAPPPTAPAKSKGKAKKASAPMSNAPPALATVKPVLERTLTEFLDTCRAQDRVLVLFAGHAVEIEDVPYLVPLEGDLTDKETLISFRWVYDKLAACRATQKVLILDVCRVDPGRGTERPGSGPMGPKLDALIRTPPAGVQVWSACVAGQSSFESDGASVFLDQLFNHLKPATLQRIQQPSDPLPVDTLAAAVNKATEADVLEQEKAEQTPLLAGKERADGIPFDPNEPPPARLVLRAPEVPGGAAPPAEVRKVLDEIDIPPIKLGRGNPSLKLDAVLPFAAERMEKYRADYASIRELLQIAGNKEKYPLRAAVVAATDVLRKYAREPLIEVFTGGNNDKVKQQILDQQRRPATIILELDEALADLRKVEDKRDEEPSRRWQAHYDFIRAEVLARLAYVHEYNLMLGRIRQDRLPDLEPKLQQSWRLASREKLQSGKEIRDLVSESKKLLDKLARQHRGTPWEVLARRERLTALGLEWQASR